MAEQAEISSRPYYRVAFDLMSRIAAAEPSPEPTEAREYYFNLYNQCYNVVFNNKSYEDVKDLKKKQPSSGIHFQ